MNHRVLLLLLLLLLVVVCHILLHYRPGMPLHHGHALLLSDDHHLLLAPAWLRLHIHHLLLVPYDGHDLILLETLAPHSLAPADDDA